MRVLNVDCIYFLGPEGTYTHQALNKFLNLNNIEIKNIKPLKNIKTIIKAVEENKSSMAVLPIENSIEGIVRETIDNFIKVEDNNLKIIGEIVLPINHYLLSVSNDKSTIKTVISHPQALAQCQGYLQENFKDIHILEEPSTSAAALRVKKLNDLSYGAIANEEAGKLFDLKVLDIGVNDEKDNKTRFIVLGRTDTKSTGEDKTSIVLSTTNTPGSLSKVLNVFDKYNINLSYIDSRPSKKNLGKYNFFIDLEGHIEDKNVDDAIKEIKPLTLFYRFNGSYKKYRT